MFERIKIWSRAIKRDVHAIYLASRDPRVPWYAKALGIAVAAYALSPIDLIPDFIPVLGYLDDLIIVPLGIALIVRLIPADVMTEHRALAAAMQDRPVSIAGATAVIAFWLAGIGLFGWLGYRYFLGT
ncbi:MAG: YkvA family protein [bacterium]|nr:YkvA family protein [bacterium]